MENIITKPYLREVLTNVKAYVDGKAATATVAVDTALSSTSENPVQNKAVQAALAAKADTSAIPTKTSQLTNDSGFLTAHQDISGKQDKLTAGTNITIADNVISATGGGIGVYTESSSAAVTTGTVTLSEAEYTYYKLTPEDSSAAAVFSLAADSSTQEHSYFLNADRTCILDLWLATDPTAVPTQQERMDPDTGDTYTITSTPPVLCCKGGLRIAGQDTLPTAVGTDSATGSWYVTAALFSKYVNSSSVSHITLLCTYTGASGAAYTISVLNTKPDTAPDTAMSDTSTNTVTNAAIKAYVDTPQVCTAVNMMLTAMRRYPSGTIFDVTLSGSYSATRGDPLTLACGITTAGTQTVSGDGPYRAEGEWKVYVRNTASTAQTVKVTSTYVSNIHEISLAAGAMVAIGVRYSSALANYIVVVGSTLTASE